MPDVVLRKAAQDLALEVSLALDCHEAGFLPCRTHDKPLRAALKALYIALDPWPAEEAPNAAD
jgi:hypothetical protein